jgi:hypothetical protein
VDHSSDGATAGAAAGRTAGGGANTTGVELPGVTTGPVAVVTPEDNFGTGLVLQTVDGDETP